MDLSSTNISALVDWHEDSIISYLKGSVQGGMATIN